LTASHIIFSVKQMKWKLSTKSQNYFRFVRLVRIQSETLSNSNNYSAHRFWKNIASRPKGTYTPWTARYEVNDIFFLEKTWWESEKMLTKTCFWSKSCMSTHTRFLLVELKESVQKSRTWINFRHFFEKILRRIWENVEKTELFVSFPTQ